MLPSYCFDGILVFHFRYTNIPQRLPSLHKLTRKEVKKRMDGQSKRSLAVALASFAVGAVVAVVLGDSTTRAKLAEHGKKAADRSRRLLQRAEM
jgi:hypothetical protein